MSIFLPHTKKEHTDALANYLPNGRLFESKNMLSSNLRRLLEALSCESQRFEQLLSETFFDFNLNNTNLLLENWEAFLGIPDECFNALGTIEERRLHVLVKFAQMNVSTSQDFIDLALTLGFVVTIEPSPEEFTPPYAIPTIPHSNQSLFVWFVTGVDLVAIDPPYDVPFTPGLGANVLECIFDKLKPAMTRIIFRNSIP